MRFLFSLVLWCSVLTVYGQVTQLGQDSILGQELLIWLDEGIKDRPLLSPQKIYHEYKPSTIEVFLVSVCVNSDGLVTEASSIVAPSTPDSLPVAFTLEVVKTFRFAASDRIKQCGIVYVYYMPDKAEVPSESDVINKTPAADDLKAQEDDKYREQEEKFLLDAKRRASQEELNRKKREQDEYNKKKGRFGEVLGGLGGPGQGKSNKPDNQETDGKNQLGNGGCGGGGASNLPIIGGGLIDRKLTHAPKLTDNSQKTGTVVVDICVNLDGNVTNATYKMKGSTTQDKDLVNKALASAKKCRFAASNSDNQCGTIAFNFKLQ